METDKRFGLASLLLIAALFAGYGWGLLGDVVDEPYSKPYLVRSTNTGIVAVFFLAFAEVSAIRSATKQIPASTPLSSILLPRPWIILPGALAVFAAFLMIYGESLLSRPVAWEKMLMMAPYLLANGHFARKDNLPGVLGCCLFAAVLIAVMVFNLQHGQGQGGFS